MMPGLIRSPKPTGGGGAAVGGGGVGVPAGADAPTDPCDPIGIATDTALAQLQYEIVRLRTPHPVGTGQRPPRCRSGSFASSSLCCPTPPGRLAASLPGV